MDISKLSPEELDEILDALPSVYNRKVDHVTPEGVGILEKVDDSVFYDPDAKPGHEWDLLTAKVEKELREERDRKNGGNLYDKMSHMPILRDRFINAVFGLGSAAHMSEREKRDLLSYYTEDDVRMAYEMDFI